MNNIAIQVEELSKRYEIAVGKQRHDTLRDQIVDGVKALFSTSRPRPAASTSFWALRDIHFQISPGELVGVIGKNGAGKSTLLKILSRITAPTSGRAEIHGRVSSLLEVGTGFHAELTGRENIYLNGAILGMKKAEIDRKFDEIVAFAEVEKFIETPVKRYSSGMYVRLAFAVAAHLEPEVLIVDEVLAVGDARFQKKCLTKMKEVGQQGRTVLFVSHSMQTITRLCPRVLLLDSGTLLKDGPAYEVVSAYLNTGLGTAAAREWPELACAPGDEVARLRAVGVRSEDGNISEAVDIRRKVVIQIEYDVLTPGHSMFSHFQLFNQEGVHVFSAHDVDPAWRRRPRPPGRYVSKALIPENFLSEGTMYVGVGLLTVDRGPRIEHYYEHDAVAFHVIDSREGDSARGDYLGPMAGVVRPLLNWTTRYEAHAIGAAPLDRERVRAERKRARGANNNHQAGQ
jgi:homopolymeric O-antigen transport system ATP-binding protein